MSDQPRGDITELLLAWQSGDQGALERLTPVVYQELHRLARSYMARERPGHTLQPTALVNEAFIRLINWRSDRWEDRAHFFGMAAQLMRRILVDFARRHDAEKRRAVAVALEDVESPSVEKSADLVALDEALCRLSDLHRRHGRVVELRFFGGLTLEEVAQVLGVSVGTVRRDWSLAKAWIYNELRAAPDR